MLLCKDRAYIALTAATPERDQFEKLLFMLA